MEKTEFIYEKHARKVVIAWVIAMFLAATLVYFIRMFSGLQLNGVLSFVAELLLTGIIYIVCVRCFNYFKLFQYKGYYWVNFGNVYIEKNNKTYSLSTTKWVSAFVWRLVFNFGYGRLTILLEDGDRSFLFCSRTQKHLNSFFDCELAPLLNAILDNNPQLIENKDSGTWEVKNGVQW